MAGIVARRDTNGLLWNIKLALFRKYWLMFRYFFYSMP